MSIVDRFTRDKVSRFVWGGLTLACAAVLVFAVQSERRALTRQVDAAEARARGYANGVLYNGVQAEDGEVSYLYRDLYVSVQAGIFTDPTVGLVRMWDTDGVLIFSTDDREAIGQRQVSDDTSMQAAFDGRLASRLTTEAFTRAPTTGAPEEPTKLLQVFAPLRVPNRLSVLGAVQVDFLYDSLAEAARSPWLTIEIIFAALTGLFLLMTVLSFRRSSRFVGTGVEALERVVGPVKHEPPAIVVPRDDTRETVEADARVESLEREVATMREELQASREQLQQAEEAYRYLEGRLRQTQEELRRFEGHDPEEVEARIGELQNQLRGAEAALAAAMAGDESEALQERVRDSDERAAFLQDRLRESDERAKLLQDRAREAEERASSLQERLRQTDERTSMLEEGLEHADERTSSFESHLAELRAEYEGERSRIGEMSPTDGSPAAPEATPSIGARPGDVDEETRAELDRLRAALVDAEARASSADEAVASARADAIAAQREAERARTEAAEAYRYADRATAPSEDTGDRVDAGDLTAVEDGVDAAEDRPEEADSRSGGLDEDDPDAHSPQVNDLRARLARTAARKRLGSGPS